MGEMELQGKAEKDYHRRTPPFPVCRPTPEVTEQKSYGENQLPGKTREKGIQHRSGRRENTIEASDPKKRRVSTVVVYIFLPCSMQSETPKCGSGRMWNLGAQGGSARPLHEIPCAWWKHGSCDTRLAEVCPPKL